MQWPKASMYMSPTRMMVFSPQLTADVHQHTVIQFTCSLDGKPFSVWTESGGWQRVEAVLINSGVAHGVKDFSGWQATICIMPDLWQGSRIQNKVLEGCSVRYFEAKDIVPLLGQLQAALEQPIADGARFHSLANMVYRYLLQEQGFTPPIDDRIVKAIRFIRQNIHDKIPASALASEVYLSEDRFLHLFREQMGAPLRQYILWQRLAAATEAFVEGRSAKEAAYHAGFSDPAHFSRTFLQMFGALPSSYAAIKPHYHFAFFHDI
ncbi:MAG: helix-turn-helix transcriptional regulator [Sphingobacteriales bacterium]|nr:helix-turn-helix transcriptional regulator [Sphingobacteriales bacterium]